MEVTVAIPDELVEPFHEAFGADLGRAAVEQLALDGYRSGRLSRYQVQQLLGFDNRYDTEDWLGRRGVTANYTLTDLRDDRATLDRLLPR